MGKIAGLLTGWQLHCIRKSALEHAPGLQDTTEGIPAKRNDARKAEGSEFDAMSASI